MKIGFLKNTVAVRLFAYTIRHLMNLLGAGIVQLIVRGWRPQFNSWQGKEIFVCSNGQTVSGAPHPPIQ
jgi:hypothetical protein